MKHRALVILFGAIPASGWGLYLLKAGALWNPLWIFACWLSAIALWVSAFAPSWARARPASRWAVAFGLLWGICLAAVPAGLNARAWLVYFGLLSPREHVVLLGVLGTLIAPIGVAAYCLRSMLVTSKQSI